MLTSAAVHQAKISTRFNGPAQAHFETPAIDPGEHLIAVDRLGNSKLGHGNTVAYYNGCN